MKCFYHRIDFDGICSGEIVRLKYPDCRLIGIDYADNIEAIIEQANIQPKESIFIVDFSFPREILLDLLEKECQIIWIDHHIAAIEKFQKNPVDNIQGIQINGTGACELVWKYLYPNEEVPKPVKLLADYDIWNHKNPRVLSFQYGLRILNPNQYIWQRLFSNSFSFISQITKTGEDIIQYESIQAQRYCEEFAFEAILLSKYRAICVNRGFTNSLFFKSVYDPEKHDLMMSFIRTKDKKYRVSFYSENISCKEIAVFLGGGGHEQAAGAMVLDIDVILNPI